MPFVSIRMAGTATMAQKAALVADITQSLVERLGKNPAAVQVVIEEVSPENYGSGGVLIANRDKPALSSLAKGDAHADPSQ